MAHQTILPVMADATVVLLLCYPLLLAKEKNLLARDPLMDWDTTRGTTRYQARLVERVNARCIALWDQRRSNPKSD